MNKLKSLKELTYYRENLPFSCMGHGSADAALADDLRAEAVNLEMIRDALDHAWESPEITLLKLPCGCETTNRQIKLCPICHKNLMQDTHIKKAANYGRRL
jgi:hypothetical protein